MKNKSYFMVGVCLFILPSVFAQIGSNYETTCNGNTCSTVVYSYVRNYFGNTGWVPINENIQSQNCLNGYLYCVLDNLYQVQFNNQEIKVQSGSHEFTFQPISAGTTTANTPTVVTNQNSIT